MTTATSGADDFALPSVDRLIELVAVFLLGIATVGTAWCGLQGARWNSESSTQAQLASDQHVEGARLFGLATQRISYDSSSIAQYAQAQVEGNEKLLAFYRQTLMRPELRPYLQRWETQVRQGGQPVSPTSDPAYLADQLAPYQATAAAAAEASRASRRDSDSASSYVAVTILLAAALFFAGVMSSFRVRTARVLLLVAALATIALAATQLSDLPVL